MVLLHQVLILVSLADIHMHDFIIFFDHRSEIVAMKGKIEHMAVIAPAGSEYEEDAPVSLRGQAKRFFDLGMRVGVGRIDFFGGLPQVARGGALGGNEAPSIGLLLPELSDTDVEISRRGSRELGGEDGLLDTRLRLCGEQSFVVDGSDFESRPEGEVIIHGGLPPGDTEARLRLHAVERAERGSVAGDQNALPCVERDRIAFVLRKRW